MARPPGTRTACSSARRTGRRLSPTPGSINGFASYVARYPDEHINVVLLSNRESASNLNTLAWGAVRLARKVP